MLSKLHGDNRAVAFFHAQADRTGRAFLRNCDFDPEFFTLLATRGIGNMLSNEEPPPVRRAPLTFRRDGQ
jgi:hypothetical protein